MPCAPESQPPARIFVPFDDSYRVPVDVRVSRGIRAGEILFTCGQMDLDARGVPRHRGSLLAQTECCVDLLGDVLGHAGATPADMVHLHAFYRQTGAVDEARYARALAGMLDRKAMPVMVLTPVISFPTRGAEVEIDAVAVTEGPRSEADGEIAPRAVRRGPWVHAVTHSVEEDRDAQARARTLAGDLDSALAAVGARVQDVCKLALYTTESLADHQVRATERALGEVFPSPGPVFSHVRLRALSGLEPARAGASMRVEALALVGAGDRTHLDQARHWRWPVSVPWSQALRCGDCVFVGSQFDVDGAGAVRHPRDLAAQTHGAMRNVERALAACGAGFADVLKVDAYFEGEHDAASWDMNVGIRCRYYVPPGPASTGIEVQVETLPGALLQVGCVARLGAASSTPPGAASARLAGNAGRD